MKSVIVELNRDPAAVAAAKARSAGAPMSPAEIESYRSSLLATQATFLSALGKNAIPYTIGGTTIDTATASVRVDFRYTLVYNGIALAVPEEAVPVILAMPWVKAVHDDVVLEPVLDHSVPYVRAPKVYGAVKELSRFDNMREGYEGQGIYVSIIDSGVDWSHEMFGGDPTPPQLGIAPRVAAANSNGKVVYYLPLADSAVNDTVGHGTHVASTAAGYQGFAPGEDGLPLTADDVKVHGVAPQASLMSYKVCGDVGSISGTAGCISSVIVMALEDSVSPRTVNGFPKPVAHVINLSLGGSGGPDSVTSRASDNAVLAGATVVAAAGNDGPNDATSGAPCAGRLVTCVANSLDRYGAWSVDVLDPSAVNPSTPGGVTPALNLRAAAGQRSAIPMNPMSGSKDPASQSVAQYFVYVAGGETVAQFPLNVRGRIALARGGLPATFAQYANNAAAAGAVAVVLRSSTANPTAIKAPIPAATMPPADFDYLVGLLEGAPANGVMSKFPIRVNPFYDTPRISQSSSRGPVQGYGQVKPDLSAPGTLIVAAVPPASELGAMGTLNYASISGTSMASPHVAGAAALVKQAHPGWSPDWIRTALMNTSTNLRDPNGAQNGDGTERVLDQGAGLLDVEAAVNVKALLGVTSDDVSLPAILGSHSFGEVPAINSRRVITKTVDVTLRDVSGSGGSYTLTVANSRGLGSGITAAVSPSTVTLAPNGSATVTAAISVDGNAVTSGASLDVQWYLRARRSDATETLQMPFYLRAVYTTPMAATIHPIGDDATPDRIGDVDRDGKYTVSWSYPAEELSRPCGYRVEEARPAAFGSLWYDDGEELLSPSSNSSWNASNWVSGPSTGTASAGYRAVYVDEVTATLTSKTPIQLPANTAAILTFDSQEDVEPDFDYVHVEVSTDNGASYDTLLRSTGFFSGQRLIDLSLYSGRSIRLRFRLVSDQLISTPAYQGWTIDEIRIQTGATFRTVATTSPSTFSLAVGGKADGAYVYRVVALFGNCASAPYGTTPSGTQLIEVSNATVPPNAIFTSDPNPSDTGQPVGFDAGGSSDQDEVGSLPGIVRYDWSFGDGSTASTTTPSVWHGYASAGTYRVTLTVIDDDGEAASSESLQTVRNASAEISAGGHIPVGGDKASFGSDITRTPASVGGWVTWNDKGRRVKFQSTRITRVDRIGNRATVWGEGTVNKSQAAAFVMELTDNGESGDTVAMTFGDYSASGTLAGGNVRIGD